MKARVSRARMSIGGKKTRSAWPLSRPGRLQLFTPAERASSVTDTGSNIDPCYRPRAWSDTRLRAMSSLTSWQEKIRYPRSYLDRLGRERHGSCWETDRSHPPGCSRDIFKEASLLVKAANEMLARTALSDTSSQTNSSDVEINRPCHSLSGRFSFFSFASSWFIRVAISLSREIAPSLTTLRSERQLLVLDVIL
jgi:hypothetical protein